jgi:hypothetical protein
MTVTKVYYKHRGVVFRVHEANKNIRENYMRQRALIRLRNIRQLEDEKRIVMARMQRVNPTVQAEFLRMRLRDIEQRLKEENTGY